MKIKELIERLQSLNGEAEILVSSDEELNTLFQKFEICLLEGEDKYCIFGLSGSELE